MRAATWQPLQSDRPEDPRDAISAGQIPAQTDQTQARQPTSKGTPPARALHSVPAPSLSLNKRSLASRELGAMAPGPAADTALRLTGDTQPLPRPGAVAADTASRPPSDRPRPARARRWSGDAWVLVRRGGNGFNLPGAGLPGAHLPSGAYGASQAGAVLRYRLAVANPLRPALYLRASSGLEAPRGEEAALGLSLRPLARLPLAAMAEVRVTRTLEGEIVRPAAALVSELPPAALPLGLRGEAYAQAGWVGGSFSTLFADGQARLERRVGGLRGIELRAGGGAWGGAQRGTSRLDLGPTATLEVPLGAASARLSLDWRVRVAGNAAPDTGPALTLSAGF